MPTLKRALEIAYSAHSGQVDKMGYPYILHPVRVALQFRDDASQIAALLHDVPEDTLVSLDDIRREGFSADIVRTIGDVTRRKQDESYEQFIERIVQSGRIMSIAVKIADVKDNLSRTHELDAQRKENLRAKYTWALLILENALFVLQQS